MVEVTADDSDPRDKPDSYFSEFDVICATCCSSSLLTRIDKICADKNVKFFAGDVFGYYGYMFSDLGEHEYAEEVPKPKEKKSDSDEPSPKKVKDHETVIVKKNATFTRLQHALDVDWTTDKNSKKIRRTPNTYFIMQILLKFMEQNGRRVALGSREDDIVVLNNIRNTVLEDMKLNDSVVSKEFSSYCFAELSPVCAIVGGVIGQEIIKAVSQRDSPHNNFFFYNGVNGEGLVDKIG
ncbi:ubiquitin-like 1-activating enzyme E1 A [Mytilus galloprovincialis]|uniref:Ubiquitin-like 1-activating enzyme E1 A n=2 Tax=Mytilus galloprovincialis TaxID=29158 RepID=A0A8B6BQK6_MYTGA|nr:ubiquitin-like 1-activating enzyme E1 A [Mytilus galloprovincialis]